MLQTQWTGHRVVSKVQHVKLCQMAPRLSDSFVAGYDPPYPTLRQLDVFLQWDDFAMPQSSQCCEAVTDIQCCNVSVHVNDLQRHSACCAARQVIHTLYLTVPVQLDDSLAEEVAPGSGGAQGLRTQLLMQQQAKTAQDTEEAIDEALMASLVSSAQADIPKTYLAEMGRQEYQAKLLEAVARVSPPPCRKFC